MIHFSQIEAEIKSSASNDDLSKPFTSKAPFERFKSSFSNKNEDYNHANRFAYTQRKTGMSKEIDQFPKGPDLLTIRKKLDKFMDDRKAPQNNQIQQDFSKNEKFKGISDRNIFILNIDYWVGDYEGKTEVRIHNQQPISSLIEVCK